MGYLKRWLKRTLIYAWINFGVGIIGMMVMGAIIYLK